MKRLPIGFLIVIISLALLTISCSDSDSDSDSVTHFETVFSPPTEVEYEYFTQPDHSFKVYIEGDNSIPCRYDDIGYLGVQAHGDSLRSLEIILDDSLFVSETFASPRMSWSTQYPEFFVTHGKTYHIEVSINDSIHEEADIRLPVWPQVDFPEYFQPYADQTITWELDQDYTTQTIDFMALDYHSSAMPDRDILLDPSDRSFFMEYEAFRFQEFPWLFIFVEEINWELKGRVLFSSNTFALGYYYGTEMLYRKCDAPPAEMIEVLNTKIHQ